MRDRSGPAERPSASFWILGLLIVAVAATTLLAQLMSGRAVGPEVWPEWLRTWLIAGGAAVVLIVALVAVLRAPAETRGAPPRDHQGPLPAPGRMLGQTHVRAITTERPSTTFADVVGVEEAREELQEIVEFLKCPARFAAVGARIPKGVLLVGPPGTGKTLLARAVAGEAGVPFLPTSGSEFVELYVGVGAARVRALFQEARRQAPCIIFVDEIDAVGRRRGGHVGVSHEEREQTLNQILVELDGFDQRTNVILLAATNRPDVLDPALLRPGRFDRQVMLSHPDVEGRRAILTLHARGKPLAPDVDLGRLAQHTTGLTGA